MTTPDPNIIKSLPGPFDSGPVIPPPGPTDHEPAWTQWIAKMTRGVPEAVLADGSRADIWIRQTIIEVEWIKKWKEAIGQALMYAAATGCRPGVIYLCRGKPTESIYICRSMVACRDAGIQPIFLKTLGRDAPYVYPNPYLHL